MKDRKKQRDNRKLYGKQKENPKLNASGCYDLTAYEAIKRSGKKKEHEHG
jgi:hypothetical protein